MGLGAGSRVATSRFQVVGHGWIQLVQPPTMIFSSSVPLVSSRYTFTVRFWPSRQAGGVRRHSGGLVTRMSHVDRIPAVINRTVF
jgi:hypothetical protein